LLQLLIEQITYHKDSIKIDLYEFPHIGLNLGTHPEFLDERLLWLPVPTSQRTISVAKHRFPIYLAYNGRGICIILGIAPIEPDETGAVSSGNLKARNQHDKWENPLKLAFYYRELMEQGKTKAEIARTAGVSRARVTQVMNLLNLHPEIQRYLNKSEHELDAKLLKQIRLRDIAVIHNTEEQLAAFRKLIS